MNNDEQWILEQLETIKDRKNELLAIYRSEEASPAARSNIMVELDELNKERDELRQRLDRLRC